MRGRAPHWRIGDPREFGWLRTVIALVVVLNLLDAVLTIFWATAGLAREANPLMAGLLRFGPAAFAVGKTVLVAAGLALLWRFRRRAAAVVGIFAAFLVYYAVLIYHLDALTQILLPSGGS